MLLHNEAGNFVYGFDFIFVSIALFVLIIDSPYRVSVKADIFTTALYSCHAISLISAPDSSKIIRDSSRQCFTNLDIPVLLFGPP